MNAGGGKNAGAGSSTNVAAGSTVGIAKTAPTYATAADADLAVWESVLESLMPSAESVDTPPSDSGTIDDVDGSTGEQERPEWQDFLDSFTNMGFLNMGGEEDDGIDVLKPGVLKKVAKGLDNYFEHKTNIFTKNNLATFLNKPEWIKGGDPAERLDNAETLAAALVNSAELRDVPTMDFYEAMNLNAAGWLPENGLYWDVLRSPDEAWFDDKDASLAAFYQGRDGVLLGWASLIFGIFVSGVPLIVFLWRQSVHNEWCCFSHPEDRSAEEIKKKKTCWNCGCLSCSNNDNMNSDDKAAAFAADVTNANDQLPANLADVLYLADKNTGDTTATMFNQLSRDFGTLRSAMQGFTQVFQDNLALAEATPKKSKCCGWCGGQ